MKILYLVEEFGGGGKERRLLELLKEISLLNNDFEIHLTLAKTSIDFKEVEKLTINLHQLSPSSNINLIFKYKNHFKEIQPDIVHVWSYKSAFYASLLKPFFNFKLISGFIGDTFGRSFVFKIIDKRLIFTQSNKVVSNSQKGLIAYNVPQKKGVVIHNSYDVNRFVNSYSLNSIGINTKYTIVMLANVTKYKDYNTFIAIAKKITSLRDDITFLSIGKIYDEYKDLVSPYTEGKHGKIKFIGFQEKSEKFINESTIGVLFSDCEGISNSIIEYMVSGLPVITTDLKGASDELVMNGVNGVICKKEDVFENLMRLVDNITLRKEMGRKGREFVEQKFSSSKMINQYLELYKSTNIK